jgi:general secretion pathway protein M
MIDLVSKRMPRGALFLAFNAFALLFVLLFVCAPVLSHFVSRSDGISESAAQLAHFQNIIRSAKTLTKNTSHAGDPFLPGSEERVVSADLQASLKAIATTAGLRILAIRGLQGSRSQQLQMVAASVEVEGSLPAVRKMVLAVENQKPFLFVTAASLRSVVDGEDGNIRAELKVNGAIRDKRAPPHPTEAIPQ